MKKYFFSGIITLGYLFFSFFVHAQQARYSEGGGGMHSFTPFQFSSTGEAVNIADGNLVLQWRDIHLSGRSGMDLGLFRVFNASRPKILIDRFYRTFPNAIPTRDADIDSMEYIETSISLGSLGTLYTTINNELNSLYFDPANEGWNISWSEYRGVVLLTNVSPNLEEEDRSRLILLIRHDGGIESYDYETGSRLQTPSGQTFLTDLGGSPGTLANLSSVVFQNGKGRKFRFTRNSSGIVSYRVNYSWRCGVWIFGDTCHDSPVFNGWQVDSFMVQSYSDPYGNTIQASPVEPEPGQTQTITDSLGRQIQRIISSNQEEWRAPGINGIRSWRVSFDNQQRITRLVDPEGNITDYFYDATQAYNNLAQTRTMGWDELTEPNEFVEIHYPTGGVIRYELFGEPPEDSTQDFTKRIIVSEFPSSSDASRVYQKYYTVIEAQDTVRSEVVHPDGTREEYDFNKQHGFLLLSQKTMITNQETRRYEYQWEVNEDQERVYGIREMTAHRGVSQFIQFSALYDDAGRVSQSTDDRGRQTDYTYLVSDQQVETARTNAHSQGPGGFSTVLSQYSLLTRQSRTVRGENYELVTSYDPQDTCGQTLNRSLKTAFQRVVEGNLRSASQYCYDSFGNITRIIHGEDGGDQITTQINYSANRFRPESIERPNRKKDYIYNTSTGWLLSERNQFGVIKQYTYNALGSIERILYSNGSSLEHQYLVLNNEQNPASQNQIRTTLTDATTGRIFQITRIYNGLGFLTQKEVNGEASTYTYAGNKKIGTVTFADNRSVSYTYDGFGRKSSKVITGMPPLNFEYVFAIQNNIPVEIRTVYLDQERVKEETYDLSGNLVQLDKYDGQQTLSTLYLYDALNNLAEIETPSRLSIINDIDYSDGSIRKVFPGGDELILGSKDILGLSGLVIQRDGQGNEVATSLIYDEFHRVSEIDLPGEENDIQLTYGSQGTNGYNRLTLIDDDQGSTQLEYNPGGAVESVERTVDALGRSYQHTSIKDSFGNLSQLYYPNGVVVFYVRDNHNRVTEVREGSENGLLLASLSYEPGGRLSEITYANDITTAYTYDLAGRVESITSSKENKIYLREEYEYDDRGNKTRIQHLDGSFVTYEYDTLNRLKKASYYKMNAQVPYNVQEYDYDDEGNRIRYKDNLKEIFYDIVDNKLVGYHIRSSNGNDLVTGSIEYEQGNIVRQTESRLGKIFLTKTYTYDQNNRLIQATVEDTENQFSSTSEYTYDYSGRRESKTANGKTTYYLYGEAYDPLMEVNDRGEPLSFNIFIGTRRLAAIQGSSIHFYHSDEIDNVLKVTDDQARTLQTNRYDPFGNVNFQNGPSDNQYLFAGKPRDRETGLIYFGARYYDPTLGRFLTRDPRAHGINHYVYTENNPLVKKDFFGLFSIGGGMIGGSDSGFGGGGFPGVDIPGGMGEGLQGGSFNPVGGYFAAFTFNIFSAFMQSFGIPVPSVDLSTINLLSFGGGNHLDENSEQFNGEIVDDCTEIPDGCIGKVYKLNTGFDPSLELNDTPSPDPFQKISEVEPDVSSSPTTNVEETNHIPVPPSDEGYSTINPTENTWSGAANSQDFFGAVSSAPSPIDSPSQNFQQPAGGSLDPTFPDQPLPDFPEWDDNPYDGTTGDTQAPPDNYTENLPPNSSGSNPTQAGDFQDSGDKPDVTTQTNQETSTDTNTSGDPVILHSGDLLQRETDLKIPGRGFDYAFIRTYRSRVEYNGPLGWNWDHNYNKRLKELDNGNIARFDGRSRFDIYVRNDDGTYQSPAGFFDTLVKNQDGTYTITNRYGIISVYDTDGFITSITDRNQNSMSFGYTGTADDKRLSAVTDTLGRQIQYTYYTAGPEQGKLKEIVDFTGQKVSFAYDNEQNLIEVTSPNTINYPNGKTTTYTYSSGYSDDRSQLNHNLLTVTDPKGQTYLENIYSIDDRVIDQRFGDEGQFLFEYHQVGEKAPCAESDLGRLVYRTRVVDRSGNQTEHEFNCQANTLKVNEFTRGIRPDGPPSYVTEYSYNRDGLVTSRILPEGNEIQYTYNSAVGPNTPSRGNLLSVTRIKDPNRPGGAPLVTSLTYESDFNQVKTVTDPRGRTLTHVFDNNGNIVERHLPPATLPDNSTQQIDLIYTHNSSGQVTSVTDGEQNVDQYEYYPSGPQKGYLQRITRDLTDEAIPYEFSYDNVGNIVSFTDGLQKTYTFDVNELNQVTKITSPVPENYITRIFYDENDNVEQVDVQNKDKEGNDDPSLPWITKIYTYNTLDRLISRVQTKAPGEVVLTEYQYDLNENLVRVIQPEGNSIKIEYDERDLPYKIIRGFGSDDVSETIVNYDGNGNVKQSRNGRGFSTTYDYDGFDRLIQMTDPLSNLAQFTYDANSNLTQITRRGPPDGQTQSQVLLSELNLVYDELNRLIQRKEKLLDNQFNPIRDVLTLFEYDRNHRLTRVEDDNQHAAVLSYDGLNRLTDILDAAGNNVHYVFDGNNNATELSTTEQHPTSGSQQFTTLYVYDALNRLTQTTDNNGHIYTYAYDSRHNLVEATDPKNRGGLDTGANTSHGNRIKVTYDGLNRTTSFIRELRNGGIGNGNLLDEIITFYTYDDNNRLTAITDSNLNTTEYVYDDLNRRTGVILPDSALYSYSYDAENNLVQSTQPNGFDITYTYDAANRSVEKEITLNTLFSGNETFEYDGLSRMTLAENRDDQGMPIAQVIMKYDSLNRIVEEIQNGHSVQTQFDGVGNLTNLIYPSGKEVTNTFDPLDRLSTITDPIVGDLLTTTYAGFSRLNSRSFLNGLTSNVSYDNLKRITQLVHSSPSSGIVSGFEHGYDAASQRLYDRYLHNSGIGNVYEYDSDYRLIADKSGIPDPIAELNNPGSQAFNLSTSWTIDEVNNWLTKIEDPSSNPGDEVPTDYTVNNLNQVTNVNGVDLVYDAAGNLTDDGTYLYTYDYRNLLVQISNESDGQPVVSYAYDPLGRRISKTVAATGETTQFIYNGAEVIEDRDNSNNVLANYVYGQGLDEVLVMEKNGQQYFYHHDFLGSPVAVTDENGNLIEQYEYDSYGQVTIKDSNGQPLAASGINNRYLYTGREYEPEVGLYYYRARYYNPSIGRFLQRDPIGYYDGMNLYAYVGNDPMNWIDPFGLRQTASQGNSGAGNPLPRFQGNLPGYFQDLTRYGQQSSYQYYVNARDPFSRALYGFNYNFYSLASFLLPVDNEEVFVAANTFGLSYAGTRVRKVGKGIWNSAKKIFAKIGRIKPSLFTKTKSGFDPTSTFKGERFKEIILKPGTQLQRAFQKGVNRPVSPFTTRGSTARRITSTQSAIKELALEGTSDIQPNRLITLEVTQPIKVKAGFIKGGGEKAFQYVIDPNDLDKLRIVPGNERILK